MRFTCIAQAATPTYRITTCASSNRARWSRPRHAGLVHAEGRGTHR
jgi:hypothetical protein